LPGPRTRPLLLAAALALTAGFALPGTAAAFQLAPDSPVSPNADDAAISWWVMFVLATAIAAALIIGLLRAVRGGDQLGPRTRGTRSIQGRVGAGLALLALAVFIFGIVVTESSRQVEATGPDGLQSAQRDVELPEGSQPLQIKVSGQQWLWRYEYPDGTFSYYEMVVPVDTAVVLELRSTDVHHRWWVPALGGQFDAVPGQTNQTWFQADEVGTYDGRSTEFSGPATAAMRARVRVVEASEYEAWLEQQATDIEAAQANVAETNAETAEGDEATASAEPTEAPE